MCPFPLAVIFVFLEDFFFIVFGFYHFYYAMSGQGFHWVYSILVSLSFLNIQSLEILSPHVS